MLHVEGVITAEKQHAAMKALYSATDGPNWKPDCQVGWDTLEASYCGPKYGIFCVQTNGIDVVTNILLGSCNLKGEIPDSMADFEKLRYLDFTDNKLTGIIPSGLSTLVDLRFIHLSRNRLTGTFPEQFGRLPNLESLRLANCYLTGSIPDWWGPEVPNLSVLDICTTEENVIKDPNRPRLSGALPLSLRATKMAQLTICHHDLTGSIPDALIAAWKNSLIDLNLQGNAFTGPLPASLALSPLLSRCELWENQFSGTIPKSLGLLQSKLTHLDISRCQLTGGLPETLGSATNLHTIKFSRNPTLGGSIPASFAALVALEELRLDGSGLTGTLPAFFGTHLTRLVKVELSNNSLSGSLPREWSNLERVEVLWLSRNQITGTLPNEWGRMTNDDPARPFMRNLQDLDCGMLQLSGTLPASYAAMNITRIHLQENRFNGTLPPEWSQWRYLNTIDVATNYFLTGTIPAAYSEWGSNARIFSANANRLSGTLPSVLAAWTRLRVCYLQYNTLSGTLPMEYKSWRLIEYFEIDNNLFSGTLPKEWKDFNAVVQFHFHVNQLQGTLPPEWGYMKALTSLSLAFNMLTGTLPESWHNLPRLQIAVLANNFLTGTLPIEYSRAVSPSFEVLVQQNCLNIETTVPWWTSRMAGIAPQRAYEECPATPAPAPITTPAPTSISRGESPILKRSAAAVLGTTMPLMVLSGSAPSASSQRALLQLVLSSCALDITEPLDVASNPLRLAFGDTNGRSVRGAVIGNVLLVVAFPLAICLMGAVRWVGHAAMLRCRGHHQRSGRRRQHDAGNLMASLFEGMLRHANDSRCPGILFVPLLFVLQPTVTCAVLLLAHAPSGAGDIAIGVVGVLATVAGSAWTARILSPPVFRAHFVDRSDEKQRPSSGNASSTTVLHWLAQLLGEPCGAWHDDDDGDASHRNGTGGSFVHAYGTVFDCYKGTASCRVPGFVVRSFSMLELVMTVSYGVIGGLVPLSDGGDDGASDVAPSAKSCFSLMVGMLVLSLLHCIAAVLLRPFMCHWESIMGFGPLALGLLWSILAIASASDDALDGVSQAQVWMFVISLVVNFGAFVLTGKWRIAMRRCLGLSMPRRQDPVKTNTRKSSPVLRRPDVPDGAPQIKGHEGVATPSVAVPSTRPTRTEVMRGQRASVDATETLRHLLQMICDNRSAARRRGQQPSATTPSMARGGGR